ncbi:hypothetical protein HOLleu_01892 [Holothuria leucospilota]|uniref:Uncharacterized protein n=1 Tax=Holothuria leucospilota TaxID=206669 RepID=A0A9Q1CPL0_HOLLE|nr:hypothetical protein HOLleu_01892 [Holothuria leucospilota]
MEPENIIRPYFRQGLTYREIVAVLRNSHGISLSKRKLKRILRQFGLYRRKHFTRFEQVVSFISNKLSGNGCLHGYRWMHRRCVERGLTVKRDVVMHVIRALDPEGVRLRRTRRLERRRYLSVGFQTSHSIWIPLINLNHTVLPSTAVSMGFQEEYCGSELILLTTILELSPDISWKQLSRVVDVHSSSLLTGERKPPQ